MSYLELKVYMPLLQAREAALDQLLWQSYLVDAPSRR